MIISFVLAIKMTHLPRFNCKCKQLSYIQSYKFNKIIDKMHNHHHCIKLFLSS